MAARDAPESVTRNIWGADAVPPGGPRLVQPEQLRLMTYMALAGGCRGLTFVGDAELTRPEGEPLLIEMAFLNAEIDLFDEILAGNTQTIADYKVYDPDPMERPTTANVNQKRMPLVAETDGKPGLYARPSRSAVAPARCCSWPISRATPSTSPRRWPITT